MAKKKTKNNQPLAVAPDHPQGKQGIVNAMGANAKTIGTTIAGVLIGEMIEAAVERLVQKNKTTSADHASDKATDDENGDRHGVVGVVQSAAVGVQDNLEDIRPAVREAIATIRSAVSDATPKLADVIDALKTAPQQSIQHSASGVGNITKTVMREAVNTAKSAVAVASENDQGIKKGKKKGKKKKKS